MDVNLQLFTGGCTTPARLDTRSIVDKINRILKKTKISNALIGWNKDADLSEIVQLLKYNGAEVYLWLPVFSELDALADFPPLVGHERKKIEINFDMGTGEHFMFYCPSSAVEKIIEVYEKHYDNEMYDGVFLDKIRYPSFIGGINSVLGCFCDYCVANYDLPEPGELFAADSLNPLGIVRYGDLRYELDNAFKTLFDYKCNVIHHSLENLCAYFRGKGLRIGFDLFAPFLAYFVGQDYHRLLGLADIVKPMFYGITNAPAGIPFEIDRYAKAFGNGPESAQNRKESLMNYIGFGDGFINSELAGIKKIIEGNALPTKLYAGIELNYIERIAPVTSEYIRESIGKTSAADGIVASWDLNTIPDSHIDCLLNII